MSDERLDRLEQRLAVLEGLVRQLVAGRVTAPDSPHASGERAPRVDLPPVPPPRPPAREPGPPHEPPPRPNAPAPAPGRASTILTEQWLGQRGLLAVGVLFVILAAGYLLKLSFDRGWISPLMRCIGGAIAGAGIGALGWRLHGRGTRTYGAALVGCGAAIIYLAVWAAARLYAFLPPTPAIAGLALVSLGLAAVALAIDVQALLATAALGAFLAPIVIGKDAGSVNFLLVYLGAMGGTLGWIAARRHWRLATFVVVLAYFGIAGSGVLERALPTGLYLYGILGGSAGLFVGLRERWFEARFLAFVGGWTVLGIADRAAEAHWFTLAGAIVLSVPIWWRGLTAGSVWPAGRDAKPLFADSLYFYLTPFLLAFATRQVATELFDRHPGLTFGIVAVPYLAAGLTAVRRPFALVGAVCLATGASLEWSGLEVTWALLGLAHLWVLVDLALKRADGRWYALAMVGMAAWHLISVDLPQRPTSDAAFTGPWALTLWWAIEAVVLLAVTVLRDAALPTGTGLRAPLWSLAGLMLLFGVTGELLRVFELSNLGDATADLAGGLAVSAWWICFAAACFGIGFTRQIRPLRWAGFLVAGMALAKVVLVDLSTLDALYRVGSAFILGVVSLGVAYAYHRNAGAAR